MTIAACYLSSEGIVFGADSTTTMYVSGLGTGMAGAEHHYNFAQKIFQLGDDGTVGMTMWGLGNLLSVSYRTLVAQFADELGRKPAQSMTEITARWGQFFWATYARDLTSQIQRAQTLASQVARSANEQAELDALRRAFSGGFCIGGYLSRDRIPAAFEVTYDPSIQAPLIDQLQVGRTRFWGCPNLINRLVFGLDEEVLASILQSGKWTGTQQDLFDLLLPYCLGQPFDLPIREAIDWVHASIYTTIKTMKFSHMAPVCGGPVEIAVITTDRRFRWVRHKRFDAAICDGGPFDVQYNPR